MPQIGSLPYINFLTSLLKASFDLATYSKIFSRRIIPTLRLATVLILAGCAVWLGLWGRGGNPKTSSPAPPLPELRGQEAVEHLKQEGLYDSLAEAMAAAKYDADTLPTIDAYQFSNPAQGLRATFTSSGARLVSSKGGRERELSVKLTGYGYGSRTAGLDSGKTIVSRNRIEREYSVKESAIIHNLGPQYS